MEISSEYNIQWKSIHVFYLQEKNPRACGPPAGAFVTGTNRSVKKYVITKKIITATLIFSSLQR